MQTMAQLTDEQKQSLRKRYASRLTFSKHSKYALKRCAGQCGCSDNLTEVTATPTPSGTYLLCPVCLADEEME